MYNTRIGTVCTYNVQHEAVQQETIYVQHKTIHTYHESDHICT